MNDGFIPTAEPGVRLARSRTSFGYHVICNFGTPFVLCATCKAAEHNRDCWAVKAALQESLEHPPEEIAMTAETTTAVAIAERSLSVIKATEARLAVAEHLTAWKGLVELGRIHMATGLAPSGFNTPEKCALALLKAIEIGVPLTAAYQFFYVVHGRVGVMAEMVRALISSRMGDEGYIHVESSTPEAATCVGYRKGRKPVRVTYTIRDAMASGIYEKRDGTWKQWPAEHCVAKASIRVGRYMFPDILSGLPAFGRDGMILDAEIIESADDEAAIGGGKVEILDGDFRTVDPETGEVHAVDEEKQPGDPNDHVGTASPAPTGQTEVETGGSDVLELAAEYGIDMRALIKHVGKPMSISTADRVVTDYARKYGVTVDEVVKAAALAAQTGGKR